MSTTANLPYTEIPQGVANPTTTVIKYDGNLVGTATVQPASKGLTLPQEPPAEPLYLGYGGSVTWNKYVLSLETANPPALAQLLVYPDPKNVGATNTPDPQQPAPTNNAATPNSTPTPSQSSGSVLNTASSVQPTVTSQPSAKNSSDGLGAGVVAGVAVGCLAAGALIAGLVLWFCWRRKRVSKAQYSQADTYASASHEKGFSTNTIPLTGQRHAATLGRGLPQPLEDKAISGDVSKISNAIKNHVQSYYHTSQVNPGLIDYDDLQALGSNLSISVGTLTTLLGNAATREIALRFIIAWVVISKVQPSKDPSKTLLPSEVADCYQAISAGDRSFQDQASLTARWRVMTAELMQSSYVRNPFSPSDSRHASIQATLATLDNVLQPYADTRMNNGERKRNLEELLKRAALFAFTLFSQPSAWEFEWQDEQGVTSGELCIFPALVQVADETGQSVNPPRPFSEAVVRRLDA
ncbi:hypothetical protein GT037_001948 [Alternaria burnsii]|uniref:Uncharacterized protein n=1 Tax=Alternaria burnsii TaxID=1187904 RepID=A0A8H7ELM7_9PLEO|nr:uncharacterized protein GT037_001948 [Alternaria burnsii]KAF7680297.1 hypothetical protein GT037_001948 [Alternaria burnsii]CAI9628657.1 unnamed protein product [Alternaria burnsii]